MVRKKEVHLVYHVRSTGSFMASCCETSLLGCSCGSSKHGDVGTGRLTFSADITL